MSVRFALNLHRRHAVCVCVCLSLLLAPGLEANAQAEDADTVVSYGSSISGRIDNGAPRAVYYFDGLRGEVISINLRVTGGDLDPLLTIVNNQGAEILSLDDGGGSRVPSIPALRIPQSDRYYVIVGRFGYDLGVTSGGYELTIERVGVSSLSGSMLRYGDQVINTITDMNPQLYYSFQAERGDIINIRMRRVSGDLDPYLQVVDSETFVIADNDDVLGAAVPFDAAVEGLVIEESGAYVVIASRYGQAAGTSSGNFVLIIEEAQNSGLGNSIQVAQEIAHGESAEGSLDNDQPARYYRFEARTNDLIGVRMTRISGGLDTLVVLANAGLQELVSDDDSAGGQNAEIRQFLVPADGVYYIIATRFDREAGTSAGNYKLELISLGSAFDGVPEGVQRIGYGSTVTGSIDDSAPEVEYAFWGTEGDIITLSMNRGDGNLDPVVSLLDGDKSVLASDDDSGSGQNARIDRFVLPASGAYYVRASRYSGEPPGDPNTRGSFILVLARRFN